MTTGVGVTASASVGLVETKIAVIDLPDGGLRLEHGGRLPELRVAYETYGELSEALDNVAFICHALTGDAHVAGYMGKAGENPGWWDEMVGPGKGIDTRYYHVVCANILGGCKGTTGPSSVNPETGRPYGSAFPSITVGDVVTVHRLLLRHLGIERVAVVVGGSLGGMQALEWAIRFPDMVDRCVCVASAAGLSAQALAFDAVGRDAITADPDWQGGDYYESGKNPARGLAQARKIGHITYLSPGMMTSKFGRGRNVGRGEALCAEFKSNFEVESYLEYQGAKFVRRFDANSYLHITQAIDQYDLAERFGTLEDAFAGIKAKMLVVALSDDWLFPPAQSREIANALIRAGKQISYCELHAPHGHDAFLIDIEYLAEVLRAFLPWVTSRTNGSRAALVSAEPRSEVTCVQHEDCDGVLQLVERGARVLDLGCGDGCLLTRLMEERATTGMGVDIDIGNVISVVDRGHEVLQGDIDRGLSMLPDGTYDYAILSQTLQVLRRPREVLREMLRVARQGIVTFPNFGYLKCRTDLWMHGRMPVGKALPFEWYDTPNIHLFTLRDFFDLCRVEGLVVRDVVCLSNSRWGRMLVRAGMCNLGAERVVARLSRADRDVALPRGAGTKCRGLTG